MREQYKANKACSVVRFKELYGEAALEDIRGSDLNGGDYHDIPEAVLMAYALSINPLYVEDNLPSNSHHHGSFLFPGKHVKKEQRFVPCVEVGEREGEEGDESRTPKQLLISHREYKDMLLVNKHQRKEKKESKKLTELVAFGMGNISNVPTAANMKRKGEGGGNSFKSASKRVKR
jgi:hypothetical protein